MIDKSIIIIPTLNERKNLEKLIPAIFELMPEISVLVVDDNSNDGTAELLNSLRVRFVNLFVLNRTENFGYGKSCIDGFKWTLAYQRAPLASSPKVPFGSFKYVVTMDADFSHDYRFIPLLLEKLKEFDVVIGSRYVPGGKIENWRLHRRILSKAANFYVRSILNLKIKDLTTGFNAYRREAVNCLNLSDIQSDGYAFLVEFKYKLAQAGVKISEYPIIFSERREGQSKMSSKIIWESVKLPWSLKFKA